MALSMPDQTWQVGIGWGLLITALTVAGVWYGVRAGSMMFTGLGVVGWLLHMAWLEKGVTK